MEDFLAMSCIPTPGTIFSQVHKLEAGTRLTSETDAGGKRILRSLLERYLRGEIFTRPKCRFPVPLPAWFAGPLPPAVDRLAASPRLVDSGWLRADCIRSLVQDHVAARRDHRQKLFNLLVLDEWLAAQ